MSRLPDSDGLDYAEWLARLVIDNADSPNFTFGPLDQKRLARAVLNMLPVVREVETLCGPYGIDNPPESLERALTTLRAARGEEA